MSSTVNKQLGGVEDLLFGQGTVAQERGDTTYNVAKINATKIPYSGDEETSDMVSIKTKIDLLELEVDANSDVLEGIDLTDASSIALSSDGSALATDDGTDNGNIAIGVNALASVETHTGNIAIGSNTLPSTINSANIAIGHQAGFKNTTGYGNTGIGYRSCGDVSIGDYNIALGYQALYNNMADVSPAGDKNIAIGDSTMYTLLTGSNNVAIGSVALTSSANISNEFTLGNSNHTNLRCNDTTISSLSDKRDKADIKDLTLGLDFLNKLRPISHSWDRREWYENGVSDGSKISYKQNDEFPNGGLRMGFIAQELRTTINNLKGDEKAICKDTGIVSEGNKDKLEIGIGYLLPVLVKAIQELTAEVELLKTKQGKQNDNK